jgi:hypothetical protein
VYQELNTAPCRKKVPVTDTRARTIDTVATNRPTSRSLSRGDYGWTPRQDSLKCPP